MSYNDFLKIKNENKMGSRLLLFGNEAYLLDRAIAELREVICSMMPELNCMVYEGSELTMDTLSSTCESLPILDERRLVVVKNNIKGVGDNFVNILKNLSETTLLVWVIYGAVDKRTKQYGVFKKDGLIFEIERVDREELSKWVMQLVRKGKKSIDQKALYKFVQTTGYLDKNAQINLYHIENEVNKLMAYVGDEQEISVEAVEILTTKSVENDIFKLINACRDNKTEESLKAFQQLMFWGDSPMGILGMVTKQIKNMYYAKNMMARGTGSKEVAQKLKMHEFAAKQCINAGSRLDERQIKKALEKCLKTEMDFKSGRIGEKLAMEILLTDLF